MIEFENKKYPSITVQSIILGTNILLLQHTEPSIFIFISISIVLTLFALQVINHRFYYYFPYNQWANRSTPNIDTYILYVLTFSAFFFLMISISQNFILSFFATTIIVSSPFIWRFFVYPKVRVKIAEKLRKGSTIEEDKCSCCGAKAIIGKKVLAWNKGYEIFECLGKCGKYEEGFRDLNIG